MRENADQNNSEYGHFLRSVVYDSLWINIISKNGVNVTMYYLCRQTTLERRRVYTGKGYLH